MNYLNFIRKRERAFSTMNNFIGVIDETDGVDDCDGDEGVDDICLRSESLSTGTVPMWGWTLCRSVKVASISVYD